jgi:hypothetical protein
MPTISHGGNRSWSACRRPRRLRRPGRTCGRPRASESPPGGSRLQSRGPRVNNPTPRRTYRISAVRVKPDVTARLAPASRRGNQFGPCLAQDWPLGAPLVAGGLRSSQKVATVRPHFPALPGDRRGAPAPLLLVCCECWGANGLDRRTGETGCQRIKTPSASPADDGNVILAEWARPSSPSLRGPLRGETSRRWRRYSPLPSTAGRLCRPSWHNWMGASSQP